MMNYIKTEKLLGLPKGFIVFLSGVPGVGKTTISYELLKCAECFRIIEETDILRDALRGYNSFIRKGVNASLQPLLDNAEIFDHTKLLSFEEAKQQCAIMKNSFDNIITRQQRKGISSIINGVHVIPEVLKEFAANSNIIFINLYVSNQEALYNRLLKRDPNSYMLKHIPYIFSSNLDLYHSTDVLAKQTPNSFYNIDVTTSDLEEALSEVITCIVSKARKNNVIL